MKIILVLLSFALTLTAHADRLGNGGDYVICNKNTFDIRFYDYYELTEIKNQKAIFPEKLSAFASPFKVAKQIIMRQPTNNFAFQKKISDYIDHMNSDSSSRWYDIPLKEVDDNPDFKLKRGCNLGQVVISGPENKKWIYEVYGIAWENMKIEDQVALVLHETIYRMAFELGHTNSLATKLLNQALLTSGEWSDSNYIYNLRKTLKLNLPNE